MNRAAAVAAAGYAIVALVGEAFGQAATEAGGGQSRPPADSTAAPVSDAMQGISLPSHSPSQPCLRDYPITAIFPNVEDTMVSFVIASDGTVKDIKLIKSSGADVLDNAFIKCVATWRYKPAKKDGIPVDFPHKAAVSWRQMSPP